MRPLCPCCLLLVFSLGVQGTPVAPRAVPEQVHLSYPGKFPGPLLGHFPGRPSGLGAQVSHMDAVGPWAGGFVLPEPQLSSSVKWDSGAAGSAGNDCGVQTIVSVLQRGPLLSLFIVSPHSCLLILDLGVVVRPWTLDAVDPNFPGFNPRFAIYLLCDRGQVT